MIDIWQKLKEETRPIFIYGTGDGADKLLDRLIELGIEICGVFASDGFVRNRSFRGYPVLSEEGAREKFGDFVALLSFGTSRAETMDYIKSLMERVPLFMPEVPVCGTQVFDLEFAREHKSKLEKVYNSLADEKSKETMKNLIMFKLTGELEYLFQNETDEDEVYDNILHLNRGDSYLDLGAYNGDTVLEFISRFGDGGNIVAVEPDIKNYKKLCKNTEGKNIEAINAAVMDSEENILFSQAGTRGSHEGQGEETSAITIDAICKNRKFDFIKFDVEGAELKAVEGGKETLKRDKPKMLISCYHKSEDYFTIPLKVLEINPEYKLYMRHFPSIPAWDTNFYFN